MLTWAKKFFMDETAFKGYMRFLLLAAGGLVASGTVPLAPIVGVEAAKYVGPLLMGAAGMIRAGEPNKPEEAK